MWQSEEAKGTRKPNSALGRGRFVDIRPPRSLLVHSGIDVLRGRRAHEVLFQSGRGCGELYCGSLGRQIVYMGAGTSSAKLFKAFPACSHH